MLVILSVGALFGGMMPSHHSHVLRVAEKNPQLNQSQGSNPGNGKETNPLDAEVGSQTKTGHCQPEPPAWAESLAGTLLVLIRE